MNAAAIVARGLPSPPPAAERNVLVETTFRGRKIALYDLEWPAVYEENDPILIPLPPTQRVVLRFNLEPPQAPEPERPASPAPPSP